VSTRDGRRKVRLRTILTRSTLHTFYISSTAPIPALPTLRMRSRYGAPDATERLITGPASEDTVPERITVLAIACALSANAQPWNSQLLPKIGGKYVSRTVNFGGRDWKLDDFSYVGYKLGETPLATVPCHKVLQISATNADISKELQAAIDAMGAAGG